MTYQGSTAAAILLLCAQGAWAQETAAESPQGASYGGLGLRLGTAGIGIDYTYGINRYFDVRAGYHFGSYSDTLEEDGIDYDGKIKISGASLMLDIKPFAGGFRISTGLFTASPEFELKASGRDDYEVGASTYTGDLRIDGGIDLGSTAPYLGLGWGGTSNGSGFGASFDLGVMFTASPDVTLDVNDPNDPRAQQFQADKEAEIANLEEDAKDFKLWPVLMFGLHYRF